MRAALYARVSTEEQVQGYSLDAQRRAFRNFCEQKQWDIYYEYVEEGRSARSDDVRKRPIFLDAIKDALDHQYDILVVHKIDRFSRKERVTKEYFEILGHAGVGFVSILEQMDFSTPWGKLALTLMGGLAEFYSDNLSQETKKGWTERRKQGLYCGPLPFGVEKGEDGLPVPKKDTCPGLQMAFELAAQGKSHREVAMGLNGAGYTTTKGRPFSKDTVDDILQNRFYLGELPVFNGKNTVAEWVPGKHQPLIASELFDAALIARERNRNFTAKTTRTDSRVSSLSGIARCGDCGSTLRTFRQRGTARLVCNTRLKNGQCHQKSARLDVYEDQLLAYLEAFHIPEDYQVKLLEAQRKVIAAYDDVEKRKSHLKGANDRLQELYQWGHKSKADYIAERNALERELQTIEPPSGQDVLTEKLATFLKDVASAWKEGREAQRNQLARQLFEAVWIKEQRVVGVTPRPELKPFFDMRYNGLSDYVLQWRPGSDSNRRSLP